MRDYHEKHRQMREDVSKALKQVMRDKGFSSQDIADKVYRDMGYNSTQSAISQISAFRNGRANTFQSRRRPFRNQSLSFNQKELNRLKVLFETLEIPDESPICDRLRTEYPSRERPLEDYSSFNYHIKPKTYLDSLDSALL